MKKILITATVQSHICQFHIPFIKHLKELGYTVDVAAKNNLSQKPGLKLDCADRVFDVPFARSPFSASNIKAYKELKQILKENDYDIIYCNTPMGSVITRLATAKYRKSGTKVIYTAHGFHFFRGAPVKNWCMYYPIEKIMAHFTDTLITMNREDLRFAIRKLCVPNIEYIHGIGFDKDKFSNIDKSKRTEVRKGFGIPENAEVMISVGELNNNKNQISVIEAMKQLGDDNLYYIICGNGPNAEMLHEKAKEYGLDKKIIFPGYRRDLDVLFSAADIFIHTSFREGLPLSPLEAMASGLKPVCSNIRGIKDIVSDGETGLLIDPHSIQDIAEKIKQARNWQPEKQAVKTVTDMYSSENVVKELVNVLENTLKLQSRFYKGMSEEKKPKAYAETDDLSA